MNDDDLVATSEGGSSVYVHSREKEFQAPETSGVYYDEIVAHVENHIGPVTSVIHELISDLVHLDILYVAPTEALPVHSFVTAGVSDLPMNTPDDFVLWNHCELLLQLPATWEITKEAFDDENNYWPIRWLKMLGRLPHEYDTWIGSGHTIPNGDPAGPLANTPFVGMILSRPRQLDEAFESMLVQTKPDQYRPIHFYAIEPLYQAEMDLKLYEGAEALEALFVAADISPVIDIARENVAPTSSRATPDFTGAGFNPLE